MDNTELAREMLIEKARQMIRLRQPERGVELNTLLIRIAIGERAVQEAELALAAVLRAVRECSVHQQKVNEEQSRLNLAFSDLAKALGESNLGATAVAK